MISFIDIISLLLLLNKQQINKHIILVHNIIYYTRDDISMHQADILL